MSDKGTNNEMKSEVISLVWIGVERERVTCKIPCH